MVTAVNQPLRQGKVLIVLEAIDEAGKEREYGKIPVNQFLRLKTFILKTVKKRLQNKVKKDHKIAIFSCGICRTKTFRIALNDPKYSGQEQV